MFVKVVCQVLGSLINRFYLNVTDDKSSKSRRSDYNTIPTLENESHVTARRKSVSIRELAEFARAKSTESHKSIDKDGCPSLSSGISIHDKIRLEALHQGTFHKFALEFILTHAEF